MMKRLLMIGVCALIAAGASAQSDTDKALLASGPAVANPLPAFAQWTIDCTYTGGQKTGESSQLDSLQKAAQKDPLLARQLSNPQLQFALKGIRPVHIAVIKTGTVRHIDQLMEEGYKGESWRFGDIEVEQKPFSRKLNVRSLPNAENSDFAELQWVSAKTFAGVRTEGGRKCLVFKQDRFDDERHFLGTAYAYVEAETRYPVAYRYTNETRQYTILPPPTAPLTVPDEFLSAGKAMVAQFQNATPHLSAP